jgi:hypothetical protein
MTKVAVRYKVSANYLARVCQHLNVPFPRRGYWARVQHGKAPKTPPLPPARPGEVLEWEKGDSVPRLGDARSQRPMSRGKKALVNEVITSSTRESFEKARLSETGYLRPYKRNLVDLFVSREMLPQALETATNLFKRFERSGHRVMLATSYFHRPVLRLFEAQKFDYHSREPWTPNHATVVYFGSIAFGLTIYETTEDVDVVYEWDSPIRYIRATAEVLRRKSKWTTTSKHHMPSGRLALRAYFTDWRVPWEKVWVASKAGKLPFRKIVHELEADIPNLTTRYEQVQAQSEIERRRRQAEELERQRLELERQRAEAHQRSREHLLSIVDGWSLARSIEAFFEECRLRSKDVGPECVDETEIRIQEARAIFGGTDALVWFRSWKTPEEILENQTADE